MLSKDILRVIYFVEAKGINPAQSSLILVNRLIEAQAIFKNNLLVYDFELDRLFFANDQANAFLGIDKHGAHHHDDSFLENILHPVSYQLLQFNNRLQQKQAKNLEGVFYLKTHGKGKFAWVYASAKVMSFNSLGVPQLIYICFVEVERAVEYYLKFLSRASSAKEEVHLAELLSLLRSREIEMLDLIADEYTSKEIADKLNITQAAVDASRKRLIKKLKVKSVVGLVKIAVSLGITGKNRIGPFGRNLGRQRRAVVGNLAKRRHDR